MTRTPPIRLILAGTTALALLLAPASLAQDNPAGSPGSGPPGTGRSAPPEQPGPPAKGDLACTIEGSARADVLRGTPRDDVICAGAGRDRIHGLGGDDVIRGGAGADVIDGGSGADTIDGGAGRDRIDGGRGIDKAVNGSGDRLRRVERLERTGVFASAATAYYGVGPAACFDYQGGVHLHQTAPVASADHFDWIRHYNAVAVWTANGWVVDGSTWVGPFWMRTDYPEWFYYGGQWHHADQGGGESTTSLGLGGAYAPVQWINWYHEGATVFEFAPVSQSYYGVPMNQGAGYCTT